MSAFATSTTEVSTSNIPEPKALQEQTSKIVEERRARFNAAYDDAISEITKGASDKIKADSDVGHYRSILYTFYFSDVKDAEVDKTGTKIRFGDNVYLRDMITRGHIPFFKKLTDHFNTSVESKGYHTGFFKHKTNDSYNIYVSWSPRPQEHQSYQGSRRAYVKPTFPRDSHVSGEIATTQDAEGFVPHRPPFRHQQGGRGRGGGRGISHERQGRGGGRGLKGPYANAVMKSKPSDA